MSVIVGCVPLLIYHIYNSVKDSMGIYFFAGITAKGLCAGYAFMLFAILLLSGQTLIFERVLSSYSEYQSLLRIYSYYFVVYFSMFLVSPLSIIQAMH